MWHIPSNDPVFSRKLFLSILITVHSIVIVAIGGTYLISIYCFGFMFSRIIKFPNAFEIKLNLGAMKTNST